MYYTYEFGGHWVVRNHYDEAFLMGPFTSMVDCNFIVEMLNIGKLSFNDGCEDDGKEGLEEQDTVYEYIEE